MKEETSVNVWKESFLNEIRFFFVFVFVCFCFFFVLFFFARNDELLKVAGNWAT